MRHNLFIERILSLILISLILVNAIAPLAVINLKAGEEKVDAPEKTVMADNPYLEADAIEHHGFVASLGSLIALTANAIKGIGALNYASENHDYESSESWANIAISYFSGNAYELELEDTRDAIKAGFEITNKSINQLENHIISLQGDIAELSKDIDNLELKSRLDDFYTNFFMPSYTNLMEAYDAVNVALKDENTNEATLRAKLDDLYMRANEFKRLDDYITGEAFFDDDGIIEVYYDYTLSSHNLTREDSDKYYEAAALTQEFALKLFAASAIQKLCISYASSFQLNYYHDHYDEMVQNNEFVGYIVGGTSNLSTNKLTEYEIRQNISNSYKNIQIVSGEVGRMLAKMNLLDTYVGYIENGNAYYAPVISSKVKAYSGATYNLFTIQEELQQMFYEGFSFISSNPAVSVSENGCFTFDGTVNTSFTVSYVYGKDTLASPITVYEITFVPSARVFSGGYGDAKSPYLISNASELKSFASDTAYHADGVHAKLTSDINLKGAGVPKISEYKGVFDGDNHKVYGASGSYVLFSTNNGTIKNLTVSDSSLSYTHAGSAYIGVLCHGNNGRIVNCHIKNTSVTIYCHNLAGGSSGYTNFTANAGGITGINNGTIEHCSVTNNSLIKAEASTREMYNAGYVFSDDLTSTVTVIIGGIAGENSGKVNNCHLSNSTINSKIYAKYYKWSFLWSHTYNKVDAYIYYGNIVGKNYGECNSNTYHDSISSSHVISPENANKKDDSFVKSTSTPGIQGSKTASATPSVYLKSISVSSNPVQTNYGEGSTFNFAGLELVDNMGNPVYGFKWDSFSLESTNQHNVKIKYNGLETSITVNTGCYHKKILIDEGTTPTCSSNGITIGVFCTSCNMYLSGHQTDPKNDIYCKDTDLDHKCDLCDRKLSECTDIDNNHICESCNKKVSDCIDFTDHLCDICNKKISDCTDSTDHLCDVCGTKISDCSDTDNNYKCDICSANLCNCEDNDGDHFCDICKQRVTNCYDNDGDHCCDACKKTISTHADSDKNHQCDICLIEMGDHAVSPNKHTCGYCNETITECVDSNCDHICDICYSILSNHSALDGNHNCAICGQTLSNCADQNTDHICDICNKKVSDCTAEFNSHICALCKKTLSHCIDENNDHLCDICVSLLSEHKDLNDDKKCDICGSEMDSKANAGTIIAIVSASTAGCGGLGVGVWFLLRRKGIL